MGVTKILIAGGGLSGSLAAITLSRRTDVELLLLEEGTRFGGNHIWSMFDSDIPPAARWLVDLLRPRRWSDHEVRFPARKRRVGIGYNSILSSDLDSAVRSNLRDAQYRLNCRATALAPQSVRLESGEELAADVVIDARGGALPQGLELGWQKFVGQRLSFTAPHGIERPVIMDATVRQQDGFRFLYLLPFSATRLFVEDTYYSSSRALDREAVAEGIVRNAASLIGAEFTVEGSESGILPVVIAGRFEDLWPRDDLIPRLGVRGGFFHPTTSYSLPDALLNAVLLASQPNLGRQPIVDLLRGRAERIWKDRAFFQLLNRMLFRAADADQRYRVLEHFYRLPEPVIGRFYAGRLNKLDKLRIVSGRPPVPLLKALSALRARRAA